MTQNMNRKHEKHTVPPPFEEVTNCLTMYAASLGRVYTAGGFLSNNGGRTRGHRPYEETDSQASDTVTGSE